MLKYSSIVFLIFSFLAQFAKASDTAVTLKETLFKVGLAVTQAERSQGLMHRTELATDEGMLFVYSEPNQISFWMKDTLIPLDILFFDTDGKLVDIVEDAQPCKQSPCPRYSSPHPSQFVLEVAAGTAKRLNLRLGDQIKIR